MESEAVRPRGSRLALPLICLFGAAVAVAVVSGLWPRAYFVNDDEAIVRHLRQDTLAPYISPVLSQLLSLGYRLASRVPWYGLYLYAVHVVSLATLYWLAARAPGTRALRAAGVAALTLAFAVIVSRLTFTSVSMLAAAIALIGWVVESQAAIASRATERTGPALALGVLLALGFATRTLGLAGAVAAVAPLLGWNAWRLFHCRHTPRPAAVFALVGPSLALVVLAGTMPQTWDERVQRYEEYNRERGSIHDMAAYHSLPTRRREALDECGWTYGEWRDFIHWLFFDEQLFPFEKIKCMADSGGRPRSWGYAEKRARRVIAEAYRGPHHLIRFFAFVTAVCFLLTTVRRRRFVVTWGFLVAWLGYIYALIVWLLTHQRFPMRVSMSFYLAAAVAMLAFVLARRRTPRPELRAGRLVAIVLLGVLALVAGVLWARDLHRFIPPKANDDDPAMRAFEHRLGDRYASGAVIVKDAGAQLTYDPLAPPRPYEVLPLGWGTFSVPFYNQLERLGVDRGSELVPAMADSPRAFILAMARREGTLTRFVRRYGDDLRLVRVDRPLTGAVLALYQIRRTGD